VTLTQLLKDIEQGVTTEEHAKWLEVSLTGIVGIVCDCATGGSPIDPDKHERWCSWVVAFEE